MSGNQPPVRGQAPIGERDLDDAVLSGDTARVPAALQPATAVMAALRAAPAPGELNGEAAARAAYRLFMLSESGWPSRSVADPLITAEAVGRPHSHRRVSRSQWRGRRRAAVLLGAAAAAASVVAVVCALTFSGGPSGQPEQKALNPPASAAPSSAGQRVLGGGAPRKQVPTAAATSAAPGSPAATATAGPGRASSPQALCQRWLSSSGHAGPAGRPAEHSLEKELTALARGKQLVSYCSAQLSHSSRSAGPLFPGPDLGGLPAGSGLSGQHGGLGSNRAGAGVGARG
jgi:hypothetical protein